jgi:phospholipase/carboxylesterase
MSASAALTAPEKFAGFGILSGRILPEIKPYVQSGDAVAQLHAFISHGKGDEKLGIHFAREARTYIEGLDIPLQYREYDAGHELNQSMRKDFQAWLSEQIS